MQPVARIFKRPVAVMSRRSPRVAFLGAAVLVSAVAVVLAGLVVPAERSGAHATGFAPGGAEGENMALVGVNALQARSAYQPVIHRNETAGRWIAYVGHHEGSAVNPRTGVEEPN